MKPASPSIDDKQVPRHVIVAALVLGLLTITLFAPTWNGQMLYWDDDENVLHNPLVVMPAADGFKQIFTAPFSTDYYPLTYISLAIDHAVWRGHFFGYHVTQTLLHGANVFLVVLLVWRWTETLSMALLVGAWFGWHPVQVETVAWIAERKSVLGSFFFLLAWLAYLKAGDSERGKRWRLTALGLFALAVLAHALVIVLPALLVAYELCLRRARFAEAIRRTWLFFVPAIFAAVMRVLGHAESGQLVRPFRSFGEGVLTMIKVVGLYVKSLFWPAQLSNHYTVTAVDDLADTGVIVTAVLFVAWVVLTWRATRLRRWSVFAMAWFLICLSPVLELVPHPTLRADRYLYVSALGIFLLVALLLNKSRDALNIIGPLSAACLVGLTLARIPDWHDAKTLWTDCLKNNPRSAIAYYSLAGCAVGEKDWPTADSLLRKCVEIKPDFAEAQERLGAVYMFEGKNAEAREHLKRALALNPRLADAQHNLTILEQRRE
ncbi:MAG TPA: tetratricopeptide repeat protein [Verrucomicrobiae bacterium]|nr:tetratricopeptide repeat protein [Verrucomicrobiae bacterium]